MEKKIKILLNRTSRFLKNDNATLQKLKKKEYYYGRVPFIEKIKNINIPNDDKAIKLADEIINKSVDLPKLKTILEGNEISIRLVDEAVYETITNKTIWKALFISNNFIIIRENIISNIFNELTKHDTEVNRDNLSYDDVIQALNTSITKFLELHYKQPRELKHTLIDYKETAIKDYILVTQNAINHDKDIKLLYKIFPTYKRDTQGRIYNYDLYAFLYYAYGLEISFNHLYHSELLKCLGAYTFKAGRDKPILKKNAVTILQQHKEAVKLTQYSENIYLHNFIAFIKTVNTRHYIRYLLSLLVDISNNLNASKELISRFTLKNKGLKNISYKDLPQPINTLLLPLTEIAN